MDKMVNFLKRLKRRVAIVVRNMWIKILEYLPYFVRFTTLCLLFNLILLIIGPPIAKDLADSTRSILGYVCPSCLDLGWISYGNYYIGFFVLLNTVLAATLIVRSIKHRHTKRDVEYLQAIFWSKNERLPAATIDELVRRITGLESPSRDNALYNETRLLLLENINPIVKFLDEDTVNGNILMVDALWGAGKTTAVLAAVSLSQTKSRSRYIYESAFKYTGNTGDFAHDLIEALCDTLSELGINTRENFANLMRNVDFSAANLLPSLLKILHYKTEDYLTTELIHKINNRYRKRLKMGGNPLEIIVILDDMDRLQCDDIIKTLSLLSIIRRLDFIKIIVPVDSHNIIDQLRIQAKMPNPDKLIRKYLPEQKSVKLKTDEEIVEQIVRRKIKGLQQNDPTDNVEFCAAWAAIIVKLVSNRLHRYHDGLQDYKMQWLGRNEETTYGGVMIKSSQFSELLRDSSNAMDRIVRDVTNEYGTKYEWPKDLVSDARNFQDIILKIQLKNDGAPAIRNMTEKEYDELVSPWIFDFAHHHWSTIDVTLRDVMDLMAAHDFSHLSSNRAEQFKQVLGTLFPESITTIWRDDE